MKTTRFEWFYIFIVILLFVLAGCNSQEASMKYGIVIQLDKEWWPKNVLEYPFTRWTYMFTPDGKKVTPPVRLGINQYFLYDFSPDGKWLAYLNPNDNQVYVMRVSDERKVKVSSGSEEILVSTIKWLGNSHVLAYGKDKVHIQDIGCLATGRLPSNCLPPPSIIGLGTNTSFYDISPNGKKIIYTYAEYEEGHKIVKS
jgi:WD40 repeat protein